MYRYVPSVVCCSCMVLAAAPQATAFLWGGPRLPPSLLLQDAYFVSGQAVRVFGIGIALLIVLVRQEDGLHPAVLGRMLVLLVPTLCACAAGRKCTAQHAQASCHAPSAHALMLTAPRCAAPPALLRVEPMCMSELSGFCGITVVHSPAQCCLPCPSLQVETEWQRFLSLVPLLDAWMGRGVLQVRLCMNVATVHQLPGADGTHGRPVADAVHLAGPLAHVCCSNCCD